MDRRGPIRTAGLLLAACALAGCTGDSGGGTRTSDPTSAAPTTQAPTTAAPTTASPTPEATPEPLPSPTPAAAMANGDAAGALAAAEYMLGLADYVRTSGDTAPLEAIAGPGCSFCTDLIERTRTRFADGGRFTGGTLTLDGAEATFIPSGYYEVTGTLHAQPSAIVEPDGTVTAEDAAVVPNVRVGVEFVESRWVLLGIKR